MPFSALPAAQGLYDPQSERDACGNPRSHLGDWQLEESCLMFHSVISHGRVD